MADSEILSWPNSISREICVTEKCCNFHTGFVTLPEKAITVSHFLIGASSLAESYFKKLLVEKFLWIGFWFSIEFLLDLDITVLATRLRRLGTLGTSAIEVRVNQRTTCCLPDKASVLVRWSEKKKKNVWLWNYLFMRMISVWKTLQKILRVRQKVSVDLIFLSQLFCQCKKKKRKKTLNVETQIKIVVKQEIEKSWQRRGGTNLSYIFSYFGFTKQIYVA